MLLMALPKIETFSTAIDTRDPDGRYGKGGYSFEWVMEAIRWRGYWWRAHDLEDQKTLDHIKRKAYQGMLKMFRAEFLRTWTLNQPKKEAANAST